MADLHPPALFAGSFDPPTLGHYDLIERAVSLFGSLRVVVAENSAKSGLFSAAEKVELLQKDLQELPVIVDVCDGLIANYADKHDVKILVRGLRNQNDFKYEQTMAATNQILSSNLETIFLPSNSKYLHVSSSLICDVYRNGGTLKEWVSENVDQALQNKFK
jgi:pantetheine-phosphate adenylyltransferase